MAATILKPPLFLAGVQAADPDLKGSQVTVKGVFESAKLVEYIYKRTGKHAVIVKEELEKKAEEKPKDGKEGAEKKDGKDDGGKGDGEKEGGKESGGGEEGKEEVRAELRKNEYYYYYPKYPTEYVYAPAPAPQFFSDENPNACSVM